MFQVGYNWWNSEYFCSSCFVSLQLKPENNKITVILTYKNAGESSELKTLIGIIYTPFQLLHFVQQFEEHSNENNYIFFDEDIEYHKINDIDIFDDMNKAEKVANKLWNNVFKRCILNNEYDQYEKS